ncbi:MAG: glycosyltransferase family 9 protein [Methylococcaceae bacterium]
MHILIIRLGAMGDVIMATGLISALRARYPEAHIDWLTESTYADLLNHHPQLDGLILWPRAYWRDLGRQGRYVTVLSEARTLIQRLRNNRYDLVLDVHGLLKSGVWAWLAGGVLRVGLGSREGSQWLMTETLDRHSDSPLMGKEYRKLAAHLGAETSDFLPQVSIAPDDTALATQLLQAHGIKHRPVVFAPFTTRPQKHWFRDRWLALAADLSRTSQCRVILLGGPGDADEARHWAERGGDHLVNLVGQTRLGVAAALIAQARVLVGVDTGLTHLAMVLNIPTVALFGSTRPYLTPHHPRASVLYQPMTCSPCRRHPTCAGRHDCMAQHTVDTVLAETLRLMDAAS